jgi:hypothetical protein
VLLIDIKAKGTDPHREQLFGVTRIYYDMNTFILWMQAKENSFDSGICLDITTYQIAQLALRLICGDI